MENQSGHPQYIVADQGFRPLSSLLLSAPASPPPIRPMVTRNRDFSSSANAASVQMPTLPVPSHTDDSNIDPTNDGYSWRMYEQEAVQGGWNQTIYYYKCTHPYCGAQKWVARSVDRQITETVCRGHHNHPCPPEMWLRDDSARLEPSSQNYVQLEVPDAAGTAGPSMPMRGEGGEQSSGSSDSDEDDDGEVRVDGDAGDDANAIERHVLAPAQTITAETASEVGALDNGYRRSDNSHRSEKRRPKSKVWEEFTPVLSGGKVQSAECKHCKKGLSGKSTGGTSHLRRHLKICHARPGTSRVQQTSSSSQPDLSVANKLKFGQENSLEELIRAIVFNLSPFSVMYSACFAQFLAGRNPAFNMVPQATVEEKFLSVFQNEKSKLKEKIEVTPGGVFLSLEEWEWDNYSFETSFLCLTVHFIDEDWKINRRIIRCVCSGIEDNDRFGLLPEWNSEMNLHERKPAEMVLKEAVQDWSLEKLLLGVTLEESVDKKVTLDLEDNLTGRNYLLAKCKLVTIPCMVDALHELLNSSRSFVMGVRNTWFAYMTNSPERRQKYQEVLSQLHLNRPFFGSKRWYSAFYLLEAALQFNKSFPNAELNSQSRPSIEDLEAAENYCKIVRLVYHAIKVVSDPHHATFNSYFHALWSLRAALQESSNIKNMERVFAVANMQRGFERNWNKWYLWLSVAVVLDPRYKISFVEFRFKQAFSHDAIMYIREVHAKLYELYIQYYYHVIHVNEQSSEAVNHGNNGLQVGDPLHNWNQNYNTQAAVEQLKELHEYLGAGVCPQNDAFDILKWWKDNSSTYPTLAKMARDILAIPGCAVSTESAFDCYDERATLFNGRLLPETIEALICAHSWIRSPGTNDADGGDNNVLF